MVNAMRELDIVPECECFDTGIVRSISMYEAVGLLSRPYIVSLVMGVASGMPANKEWLPLLIAELPEDALWQVIAIGRQDEVCTIHYFTQAIYTSDDVPYLGTIDRQILCQNQTLAPKRSCPIPIDMK